MPNMDTKNTFLIISPNLDPAGTTDLSISGPFLLGLQPATDAPPQNAWVVEINNHEAVFTHLPWPTSNTDITVPQMQAYANDSSEVTRIASVWEMLHREAQQGPHKHGLEPAHLENTNRRTYRAPTVDEWLLNQLEELVGPNSLQGNLAWFAPEADQEQFGTPYLMFTAGSRLYNESRWVLRRVGMEGSGQHQEVVEWNDCEGFTRLAQKCFADPDVYLVEAALVDSASMPTLTLQHEKKRAVREAREVFKAKKDQLRPILVRKAMEQGMKDILWPTQKFSGHASVDELTPWQYVDANAERIYACASAHIYTQYGRNNSDQPTEQEICDITEKAASKIQQLLDERALGQVGYFMYDGSASILVSRDLAKLWPYRAAFGVAASTLMIPTEDGTGWQPLP